MKKGVQLVQTRHMKGWTKLFNQDLGMKPLILQGGAKRPKNCRISVKSKSGPVLFNIWHKGLEGYSFEDSPVRWNQYITTRWLDFMLWFNLTTPWLLDRIAPWILPSPPRLLRCTESCCRRRRCTWWARSRARPSLPCSGTCGESHRNHSRRLEILAIFIHFKGSRRDTGSAELDP